MLHELKQIIYAMHSELTTKITISINTTANTNIAHLGRCHTSMGNQLVRWSKSDSSWAANKMYSSMGLIQGSPLQNRKKHSQHVRSTTNIIVHFIKIEATTPEDSMFAHRFILDLACIMGQLRN